MARAADASLWPQSRFSARRPGSPLTRMGGKNWRKMAVFGVDKSAIIRVLSRGC
jgi:hypothetical protein